MKLKIIILKIFGKRWNNTNNTNEDANDANYANMRKR
jgi:hypothetical protein